VWIPRSFDPDHAGVEVDILVAQGEELTEEVVP
jgi:hypothetical protein